MMQAGRFRRGIFIMVFFIIMGWHAAHAAEAGTARIAQLRIKPEYLEAFMIAVREEMETSLRVEPGVVALYAVADRRDPTKMLFFELYVDDAAYQSHRNTASTFSKIFSHHKGYDCRSHST